MDEVSKFTGVFDSLKEPPQEIPEEMPEEELPVRVKASRAAVEAPQRGRGRPRSKSSDPEYQPTTVILRKVTKRRAAHMLEDREMGKDLSELIEELLAEWLEKQS
jgi:hypothetical protein